MFPQMFLLGIFEEFFLGFLLYFFSDNSAGVILSLQEFYKKTIEENRRPLMRIIQRFLRDASVDFFPEISSRTSPHISLEIFTAVPGLAMNLAQRRFSGFLMEILLLLFSNSISNFSWKLFYEFFRSSFRYYLIFFPGLSLGIHSAVYSKICFQKFILEYLQELVLALTHENKN